MMLSPVPSSGSLLSIEMIRHAGIMSHLSVTDTLTVTGTILPFGGHRVFGVAPTLDMTGGVVSSYMIITVSVSEAPSSSVTVTIAS